MKLLVYCRHNRNLIEFLTKNKKEEFEKIEFESSLHEHPEGFKEKIEKLLEAVGSKYEKVIFFMGECAMKNVDLNKCKEKIFFLKASDCLRALIPKEEEIKVPAFDSFLLCASWMNSQGNLMAQYKRLVQRFTPERAKTIMRELFKNYKRICYLSFRKCEKEEIDAKELADMLGLEFITLRPNTEIFEEIIN